MPEHHLLFPWAGAFLPYLPQVKSGVYNDSSFKTELKAATSWLQTTTMLTAFTFI